jgi:hypothetical protein
LVKSIQGGIRATAYFAIVIQPEDLPNRCLRFGVAAPEGTKGEHSLDKGSPESGDRAILFDQGVLHDASEQLEPSVQQRWMWTFLGGP